MEYRTMEYHALRSDEISELEQKHDEMVLNTAGECIVILENDGVLPFEGGRKIALFGNGARDTVKGGTGSGDVNSRYKVNVEEGLKNEGFEITTASWLDRADAVIKNNLSSYMERIQKKSAETGIPAPTIMFTDPIRVPDMPPVTMQDVLFSSSDTAIYVLSRNSGEGGDRLFAKGDYLLLDSELNNINAICSAYANVIVVLNVGGVVDLSPVLNLDNRPGAILLMSQLGNQGGNILAKVLCGKADPSGRLADTWAVRYEDYPGYKNYSHNNGNTDDEIYEEGQYIGYRYFDSFNIRPLYPFGYGLGYTSFLRTVSGTELDGTRLMVTLEVENIGNHPGKEVIQLYASAPKGEGYIDKPYQELISFAKTPLLKPGQIAEVGISFDIRQLANYDPVRAVRVLEKGDYLIRVGNHSRNTGVAAVLRFEGEIITEKLRHILPADLEFEELTNPDITPDFDNSDITNANIIIIPDGYLSDLTNEIRYTTEHPVLENKRPEKLCFEDILAGRCTVEEFTAQLTVEEMSRFAIGEYEQDTLLQKNIIGSASRLVPGAAAQTTEFLLPERGVPAMIFADGPAGLRLQPRFMTRKNGDRIPGGEIFGLSVNPFAEHDVNDEINYYQYCTAIPVATALAQSWNTDLLSSYGSLVGEEMKQYYVHLWLAPGMNIHRNPLCGRNFEYYSEDPVITGACAAAITRAVQSFEGCGTTIKHFACNNQEDNRMYSNSHVSEKALRELYLRGFEIAVKSSHPHAIMTAYNMINGIHCANSRDLLLHVARDEWGFDGVVMTDWYATQSNRAVADVGTKYKCSSSKGCITAGNDWQMPGCRRNVDDIIEGISTGDVSVADLQFVICNIIRTAVRWFSTTNNAIL